jgi:hypothetical protein
LKFTFFLLLPIFLVLYDGCGRLINASSATLVTSLISSVLAEEIMADIGIPFLSVKICIFVLPILLLSMGNYFLQSSTPKGNFIDMLSMDCHFKLIPIHSS